MGINERGTRRSVKTEQQHADERGESEQIEGIDEVHLAARVD